MDFRGILLRSVAGGAVFLGVFGNLFAEPVAYWSFDYDLRATVGGEELDGTAVNGVMIDASKSRFGEGSARFDRAAAQSIRISVSPFSQGSYTYSAWYFLDLHSIGGSDRYFVLEASNGSTWPASYGLRVTGGAQVGEVFSHDNGAAGGAPSLSFPSGSHREWRHIAVTYDAETLRLEMFLDGDGVGMLWLRADATALSPSTYLNIGAHRASTGRNWHGWIDEVAIWDRVLSQEEIKLLQGLPPDKLHNYGRAGYEKWISRFDLPETLRHSAADASGNGIANLLEYALGLDDLEGARRDLPSVTIERIGNESFPVFRYPRNPDALGLDIRVEASADLQDWQPAVVTVLDESRDAVRVRVHPAPAPVGETASVSGAGESMEVEPIR